MSNATGTDRELEAEAREIYEGYRAIGSGRMPREHLYSKSPQEMGMKEMAFVKAQEARNLESSLGAQVTLSGSAKKAAVR